MHFTKTILAALAAASSVSSAAVSKRAETWSLNGLQRDCAKDGKTCTWKFDIDNHAGKKTPCTHVTKSQGGKPASQSHGGPTFCGPYRLESSYFSNGQYSVIGVLDQSRSVIAYFGYEDAEVDNGRVVDPDHSKNVEPFHQTAIF